MPHSLDLGLCDLTGCQLLLRLACRCFGHLEGANQVLILQNVPCGLCKLTQQRVLHLLELVPQGCDVCHQGQALLLQGWLLVLHHLVDELVSQPIHGHREVDDHGLPGHLWPVMGVCELGRHEHREFIAPFHHLTAQVDHLALAVHGEVFVQDRVDEGVYVLHTALEEEGQPKLDGLLKELLEVVVESLHLEHVP